MRMLFRRWLIIAFASLGVLFTAGCGHIDEFNPINSSLLNAPVVHGFYAYDVAGNLIGSWGSPNWHPYYLQGHQGIEGGITRIYPSPARPMPSTTIAFGLPENSRVWLWAVRAIGPSEIETQIMRATGADYVVPGGNPCKLLLNGEVLDAGIHSVSWGAMIDDAGRPLSSGFYRLYLYAKNSNGGFSSSYDMLLWLGLNCDLAPAELRPYLGCSGRVQ